MVKWLAAFLQYAPSGNCRYYYSIPSCKLATCIEESKTAAILKQIKVASYLNDLRPSTRPQSSWRRGVLRILQENTIENIGNLKFGQINIRLDARSTHKIYLTFVVVFCHFEVVFAWPICDPNQTLTPMPLSVEFVLRYDIYRRLFS